MPLNHSEEAQLYPQTEEDTESSENETSSTDATSPTYQVYLRCARGKVTKSESQICMIPQEHLDHLCYDPTLETSAAPDNRATEDSSGLTANRTDQNDSSSSTDSSRLPVPQSSIGKTDASNGEANGVLEPEYRHSLNTGQTSSEVYSTDGPVRGAGMNESDLQDVEPDHSNTEELQLNEIQPQKTLGRPILRVTADPTDLRESTADIIYLNETEPSASESPSPKLAPVQEENSLPHQGSPAKTESQKLAPEVNNLYKTAEAVVDSQTQEQPETCAPADLQYEPDGDLPYEESLDDRYEQEPQENEIGVKKCVARVARMRGGKDNTSTSHDYHVGIETQTKVAVSTTEESRSRSVAEPKREAKAEEDASGPARDTIVVDPSPCKPKRMIMTAVELHPKAEQNSQDKACPSATSNPSLFSIKEPPSSADPTSSKRTTRQSRKKPQTYAKTSQKKSRSATRGRCQYKVFCASSTTISNKAKYMDSLMDLGVYKTENMDECDVFCTRTPLVKSPNLLHALALGRPIVTEDWLEDSVEVNLLKDFKTYFAKDTIKEREWRCKIRETSETFKSGKSPFDGMTIIVTPALKVELGKDVFEDIRTVAMAAGAKEVTSRIARDNENTEEVLWLAKDNDPQLRRLEGQQCFKKDLVAMSILRCNLDLDSDEFRLGTSGVQEPPRKRRKKA